MNKLPDLNKQQQFSGGTFGTLTPMQAQVPTIDETFYPERGQLKITWINQFTSLMNKCFPEGDDQSWERIAAVKSSCASCNIRLLLAELAHYVVHRVVADHELPMPLLLATCAGSQYLPRIGLYMHACMHACMYERICVCTNLWHTHVIRYNIIRYHMISCHTIPYHTMTS